MTEWKRETTEHTMSNGTVEREHQYCATINGYKYEISRGWSRWQGEGWEFYGPCSKVPVHAATLHEAKARAERMAAKRNGP